MEDYYGRIFVDSQLSLGEKSRAESLDSMVKVKGRLICQRCGSQILEDWVLPKGDYYCRACIQFGRNCSNKPLYYVPAQPFPKKDYLVWQGQLTPYQEQVSQGMMAAVSQNQHVLIHAVTGAGKTEMIYETVAKVLSDGGQVCLASPRIDVCLELYKRLSRDFSCPIALLHGESEPYKRSPLVIATTHQLLKFYRAFDLLIIDEVDAFPFVDNDQLYHGLEQALKDDGVKVFLTATSTDQLDRQVRQGKLKKLDLARRFHGNPLIVPKMAWLGGLLPALSKKTLPRKLLKAIQEQRETGYPLLLFFPHIELGKVFADCLAQHFPQEKIGFVASTTENRLELVQDFRDKELTILVSTTILERGVTFPCVDVFVLWSDHKLYTSSSLVQISGRVGRAMERPTGALVFYHEGVTKAMTRAIREIKAMNQKGGFA